MKKIYFLILVISLFSINLTHAGIFDDVLKSLGTSSTGGPDESTIISGLKEALSIGTDKAVKNVSQVDGYFGNQVIKMLMS